MIDCWQCAQEKVGGTYCEKHRTPIADLIPTTWLDPLLTGPDKVLPDGYSYGPQDIERLLRAIKARIVEAEAQRQ